MTNNQSILAEELSGQDIGRCVSFLWSWPHSKVTAIVTGELRELHFDASNTVSESHSGRAC